jgi:hypothetical protein
MRLLGSTRTITGAHLDLMGEWLATVFRNCNQLHTDLSRLTSVERTCLPPSRRSILRAAAGFRQLRRDYANTLYREVVEAENEEITR